MSTVNLRKFTTDERIFVNEEERFWATPPTAQTDDPIDPKIGRNMCGDFLHGLVEANFEFPPQTRDIGQNVVT